jgi:2-hydroxychromene-2-carboxylate isomerase
MAQPIEFYFDFSSPYGYLASTQIDQLAERFGRTVTWKPFLLGAVFKLSGAKPLVELPLKGEYFLRDFHRSAGFYGVPFRLPPGFPFAPIAASRAFYWLSITPASASAATSPRSTLSPSSPPRSASRRTSSRPPSTTRQ